MKELFLTYLNASVFGGVIILIGLLLRPIFRKAPRRILCTVWLLAAIRLLLPFHIESYFSLQPQYEPLENLVQEQLPEFAPPEDLPDWDIPDPDDIPDLPPQVTPSVPENPSQPLDWVQIFAGVWVAMMFGILTYCIASYMALKCNIRMAVRREDGVMECEHISGAFLLGYWKPRIYLPLGLDEKDQTFIIAHEKVHIQRRDHWWKLIGLVCVIVHWYNPLVWIGYTLLCRDIEITCDERVIHGMDLAERKAYSQALLNSEKRRFGILECPVAFGEVDLKLRIRNVLAYHPYGYWLTAFAISLVVFVGFCFLTSPVTEPRQTPDQNLEIPTTQSTESTTGSTAESTQTTESTQFTESTQSTEPPLTEPPVTEPLATEPPVTLPPETKPADPEPTPTVTVIAQFPEESKTPQFQLTSDGTLTIYGDRNITDSSSTLWRKYSEQIKKVVITEGLTTLPSEAFRDMDNLTEVHLCESLETIGWDAFHDCDSLRSIRIPSNVTLIKDGAFARCLGLIRVDFAPDSQLSEIRSNALAFTAITSFSAPSNLKTIESYAFQNCWRLEKVDLSGSVETLGKHAFKDCTRLTHVILGENVQPELSVFEGCSSIEIIENHSAYPFETFITTTS